MAGHSMTASISAHHRFEAVHKQHSMTFCLICLKQDGEVVRGCRGLACSTPHGAQGSNMVHTGVHNKAPRAGHCIPSPLAGKVFVLAVHGHVSHKIYLQMHINCSLGSPT